MENVSLDKSQVKYTDWRLDWTGLDGDFVLFGNKNTHTHCCVAEIQESPPPFFTGKI